MPTLKRIIVTVAAVLLVGAIIYFAFDWGPEYEWAHCFKKTTTVPNPDGWDGEMDLVVSDDPDLLTILWVSGRKPSRISTAHGHVDKVAITLRLTRDEYGGEHYKVEAAHRWGYHWRGNHLLRGPEDVWANLDSCEDGITIDATIRLWPRPYSGLSPAPTYLKIPRMTLKPRAYDRDIIQRRAPI